MLLITRAQLVCSMGREIVVRRSPFSTVLPLHAWYAHLTSCWNSLFQLIKEQFR